MQDATSGGAAQTAGWAATRGARLAAMLAALGGGLAIAGALLPWVSVTRGKKTDVLHGTSFSIGTMTLIGGIVLVLCAVVWLAMASVRARVTFAVVAVAASAAIAIAIGAGLGTKAFLDQASTKAKHHQKSGKAGKSGSNPSSSATGAVFIPDAQAVPVLTSAQPAGAFVAQAEAGKGKKNRKAVTSTLQAGVFIALAGGILGLIGGLWLLLAPSGRRAPAGPSGEPATTGPPGPAGPPASETLVAAPAGMASAGTIPAEAIPPPEAETTQLPAMSTSTPDRPVGPLVDATDPAAAPTGPTEPTVRMNPAVDDPDPSDVA